jgi:hypothetical protein
MARVEQASRHGATLGDHTPCTRARRRGRREVTQSGAAGLPGEPPEAQIVVAARVRPHTLGRWVITCITCTIITTGGRGSAGPASIVVMYVVAALMFAMAVGFFVIAESTPLLYSGFTMGAGVLAATGVVLLVCAIAMGRRRANAARLTAGGVPGQAQ